MSMGLLPAEARNWRAFASIVCRLYQVIKS